MWLSWKTESRQKVWIGGGPWGWVTQGPLHYLCWSIRRSLSFLQKNVLGVVTGSSVKPVDPKGNQSWIFIGRTDDEAEAPILWPPDAKSWLIRKDSDAGKDWGQEEKGMTEDEMFGWHHWLNGHEYELQEIVKNREGWHAAVHGVAKSWTGLGDWTTATICWCPYFRASSRGLYHSSWAGHLHSQVFPLTWCILQTYPFNLHLTWNRLLCWCTQLWPTLCNHRDYSPPGSSVHGIFQARTLVWVAISFSMK